MLGATESTLPYVRSYLLTIAPFIFSFVISYNLELLLATDGFPGLATIYVLLGVILNILLDWYTIFKLNWGIVGAGLATSFSQTGRNYHLPDSLCGEESDTSFYEI